VNAGPILLLLHQSPLRTVSEEEAITTLSADELGRSRQINVIDTRPLRDDVEGGYWRSSRDYLCEQAARIRALADEKAITDIRYMGIAEVPDVLALGAYLGDERLIAVRDFDRTRNSWDWPSIDGTLDLQAINLPREAIALTGDVVLRVEISYPILDSDIDAVLGKDPRLADIRIAPAAGRTPTVGIIQSESDVAGVRFAVREALASLATMRPNAQLIHLFVAAPVSVCLSIGQELRLRNGKDVQTYRYRSGTGDRSLTTAMLLTSRDVQEGRRPLSPEDIEVAASLRAIWRAALQDVQHHARASKPSTADSATRWFSALQPRQELREAAPFPGLHSIYDLVQDRDVVSASSYPGEFRLDPETREWHFADTLLLGMFDAAGQSEDRLREHARLFFWHEYVHLGQGLTSDTAAEIGRLANCLERVDYMADVYAIIHQLDFLGRQEAAPVGDASYREMLRAQLDVALRSMWTFEEAPPLKVIQERRLRRYLNWYWRRVQLREAPDLRSALEILAQQPCIEISGLRRRLADGRVLVVINDRGGFDRLHIGIVLKDGRLKRRGSTADASIEGLLESFSQHDSDTIERFFNALIEHVK
jgi:hypothetical protein